MVPGPRGSPTPASRPSYPSPAGYTTLPPRSPPPPPPPLSPRPGPRVAPGPRPPSLVPPGYRPGGTPSGPLRGGEGSSPQRPGVLGPAPARSRGLLLDGVERLGPIRAQPRRRRRKRQTPAPAAAATVSEALTPRTVGGSAPPRPVLRRACREGGRPTRHLVVLVAPVAPAPRGSGQGPRPVRPGGSEGARAGGGEGDPAGRPWGREAP